MRILGIIPAREGSKRVKHKNFRPFAGTTLVDLAIQQAQESERITTIAVSSDSSEVLNIAAKYPEVKALQRPAAISGDTAPAIAYVRHAIAELEADEPYDIVVILQPSSPLRSAVDIDGCIEMLIENPKVDSVVSVVLVDHIIHPLKLKVLEDSMLLPYIEDEKGRFAAQDLPEVYVRNCAVYATWRRDLEKRSDIIGSISLGYKMPKETSVDINDLLDFDFAEFLFQKKSTRKLQ